MAAVFPLNTSQPWSNNGVTYEYDATEDRWYVVSTNATDQVVSDIADLNDEIDALELTVASGKTVIISPGSPASPKDGDLWFDSSEDSLTLFIYYEASESWVPAAPPVSLDGINATIEAGLLVQAEIIARVIEGEGVQDTIQAGQTTQDGQISNLTEKANANDGRITENELAITNLEITKGSVARYKVVDTVLGVAARPGELYTNSSNASLVTTLSFASVDSSSNATKPMNDGDIIEFDFGNGVVRYVAGGSNANALPVTYADGQHTFSTNEEMDVYIYPQNKQGASKEYVDAADDLKYDKTGAGYITGPVKVKVDSPSSQTCYSIYEPEGTRTYYIWNPGGLGENIKHVCLDGSDFEISTSATVSGSKKTVSPAIFGYQNITLSGGEIRPQSASADVTVSHTINTKHIFEGRAIFNLPSAGDGFTIKGNATEGDKLLAVYHNNGGETKDAVNYNGRTDGNTNIQNKASVQDLIQAGGVATPVGAIMMWMNESAPPGWFKMIGISFDINTYPLLHAYLSNTYGYLSGVIPNWRNYYPVACGTDTSSNNSDLGKKFNYKTAKPHSKFKTAISIPNGDTRTFNGAGSTNAYSDGLSTVDITGGDSITRPKSVAVHYIIKHD